jgi:hypothetical protein
MAMIVPVVHDIPLDSNIGTVLPMINANPPTINFQN